MPRPSVAPLFSALRSLLATQPAARAHLARHVGKQARIVLPPLVLAFRVGEGGLPEAVETADHACEISLDAALVARLALGDGDALTQARVNGDGVLANDLALALRGFDWVLALRPWLGDMAAARAAQAIAGFAGWRERAHQAMARSLAEYAVYETDMLADKAAVRHFVAEVDALRDDAARLEARLAWLEQRRGNG